MKIASRSFIPLELFIACAMMSWGISGGLGGGALFRELALQGRNLEWGLILCGLGAAQFAGAAIEWLLGRRWEAPMLERSVRARCVLAFLGICVWLYILLFIGTAETREPWFSLWLQSPAAAVFSFWAFVQNYKVICLLDPAVPTAQLERTMIAERKQLLRHH